MMTQGQNPTFTSTRKLSAIAVMTAACLATNYLLIGFVNVKLMDMIVFVSGVIYGPFVGMTVGAMTWLVYGTLNPFGFSLPILVATSMGESIYGLVGGLMGKIALRESDYSRGNLLWKTGFKFAVVGFLLTFIYDFFTNLVSGLTAGVPLYVAFMAGIPFALVHELSNTAFFMVGVTPLANAINRLPLGLRGGNHG